MKTIEINKENIIFWQTRISKHVIALGFFDGLHKGHQQVISIAKQVAMEKNLPLSVMSFFPHPKSVLSNGNESVDYLMPLDQKKEQLSQLGVDYFFIVEFSLDFAALSPEQFISDYVIGLGAQHVVCGYDYTYGKKGAGNASTLVEHAQGNLELTIVPKVDLCGEKISSTRIRELLSVGNVSFISKLMGHPYTVQWSPYAGLLPYYTLPAPGFYEVSVIGKSFKETGIIRVMNRNDLHFEHMIIPTNEQLTIKWHKEVSERKVKVIS